MGLIIEKIRIKWHPSNKKHFESLGYKWTKKGEEFEVWSNELSKGSNIIVRGICDECGKNLTWAYKDYIKYLKDEGRIYCRECSNRLFGKEKELKTKLSKTKTFYDWCIENNKQDILDRWDYELNECSPKEICWSSGNKYYFKCLINSEHKSGLKLINSLTQGGEGSIRCNQCNSIAQYIINKHGEEFFDKIWSDKNNIDPFFASFNSTIECWWNCPDGKHEPFKRSCNGSTYYDYKCHKCVLENNKGEKHHNWNPNLTNEEREKGRKIEGYNDFVRETLKRDNYTCQYCGHYSTNLIVHHLNGYDNFKDQRVDIKNGITLCKKCHKEFHKLYGYGNNTKKQFEEFMKNKNKTLDK